MEKETLDETEQLLMEMQLNYEDSEIFFSTFGEIDCPKTMKILNDQSISHAFTNVDIFNEKFGVSVSKQVKNSSFTFNDRYTTGVFCHRT